MSRNKIRFLVGCSLAISLASRRLFKKLMPKQPKNSPSNTNLMTYYQGKWQFIDPKLMSQHQLEITPELTFTLDNSPIEVTILDLSDKQLVLRDTYGYHLTFYLNGTNLSHFYDEANDQTYQLILDKKTPED